MVVFHSVPKVSRHFLGFWRFPSFHDDDITVYLLALGMMTVPLRFLTRIMSWIVNYETELTRTFNLTFALGVLLFLTIMGTFILRITGPDVVLSRPGFYGYLKAPIIQLALPFTSDFFEKNIVSS